MSNKSPLFVPGHDSTLLEDVKARIRDVPDFPQPGILFRDVTPLLRHPSAMREVVAHFAERYRGAGIDVIAGIESRGFIFGAPLAMELGVGFVPIRKVGKLPAEKINLEYALEYGTAALEIHVDAVSAGERVLLIDDLLATGVEVEARPPGSTFESARKIVIERTAIGTEAETVRPTRRAR